MQRRRLEVAVEGEVELVVQRPDAVPGRHGLRDVGEPASAGVELEALGEQRGELVAADAARTGAENGHEPAGRRARA